jgi:hypothetical protein
LFRKFSSDPKLLGAFASTFLLAIAIATMSLIPDTSWLAVATLTACWGTVLILGLFLCAYRRALRLISPTQRSSSSLRMPVETCRLGFVERDALRRF